MPQKIQNELLDNCHLRWVNCDEFNITETVINEIKKIMSITGKESEVANSDIITIVDNKRIGVEISKSLASQKIRNINTFSDDRRIERRKKTGFFMGDARIKITTIHSFKGWECRLLIIVISRLVENHDYHIFYTALTRLHKSLYGCWVTVVSSNIEFSDFAKKWFEFEDCSSPRLKSLDDDNLVSKLSAEGLQLNEFGIECGLEGCALSDEEKEIFCE